MASYKHILTGLIMTPSDPGVERQFEESELFTLIEPEPEPEKAPATKTASRKTSSRKAKAE